jgi:Flp pilus assembly protein TadD
LPLPFLFDIDDARFFLPLPMATKLRNGSKIKSLPRQLRGAPSPARKPLRSSEAAPAVPVVAGHTSNRLPAVLCFLLAAVTLVLYSPVGGHPFVNYDDQSYVFQNDHVKAGLTWDTLTWAMTATDYSNWHPLTWISHALDCQLFGLNPGAHHWTSAIIHALNAMLLFLLLWRVTGATWKSLMVAALFALHPLNVESVAWIAERKNVLCTFFFLLALGAYGWYARMPGLRRYLVVALMFILGLAAKPMVITLPFVLMLLDLWPLHRIEGWAQPSSAFPVPQRPLSRLVLEKLPLLALSAGSAVITMAAQTVSEVPTQALPIGVRLETSFYAYAMYLWKAIWPAHLAAVYPHPGRGLPLWQLFVGGLIVVTGLIVAWQQRFKRPYFTVGWLWYLGTAVPIIGIIQVGIQVIADRYAYIPLIGIFVIVVWEASALADRAGLGVVPCAVAASLILAALTFLTFRQIGYWRSTVDLWTHALQVTENNSMAENFLANELFSLGRYPEGMAHLRTYVGLEPLDPSAHARVGADYEDHGRLPEAIHEYQTAIRAEKVLEAAGQPALPPDMLAMTYANLGLSYAQSGDPAKAQESMKQAMVIDGDAVVRMASGLVRYLPMHPSAQGYVRLGLLLTQLGQEQQAQQAFAQAQKLDPRLAAPGAAEVQH